MARTAPAPDVLRALDASLTANPAAPMIPLFRGALRDGRARLEDAYRGGLRGHVLITRLAKLVDGLLQRAWRAHQSLLPAGATVALIAVGGYGRGELYPRSDVDLLLLTRDPDETIREFAETLLRFLWDIGLEVGHSVRSLEDCRAESLRDITVATNMQESRWLAGNRTLLTRLQQATGPAKLWPSRDFFQAKYAEQLARHRRYDDTAYNLEPNIKEGPGGLRDLQMIQWVTQRHFGTSDLHDLVRHGFLNESEYRTLRGGLRWLAQVRCGLHILAEHREDRLLFDHQRALAKHHGYRDRKGSLAVEQFMKRHYRTVRELSLLNEILLQHFQEEILTDGPPPAQPINRRFQARGEFLEVTQRNTFARSPFALLELFLVMQQHPELTGVRAATIRLLRESLPRIDRKFRADIVNRSLFMEILRQPRGITHELRRMNAYGVLPRYLPDFGRITGQMQHDLFHVYTVDEHSLMVLRNLRRFAVPEFRHEFPFASELIQTLVKPERLYLAGLFHDIAKGRGGDHSKLGEHVVVQFCHAHQLSEYDTRFIAWLVRNHLLMSTTAQRQDIEDPDVVRHFAQTVGDPERLDHLYLLTVADMRGTSPKVWNVWKDRLLIQLYHATLRMLQRGQAEQHDLAARLADLHDSVWTQIAATSTDRAQFEQYWANQESEYLLRHPVETLAWHASLILAAGASDLPLVSARYHPSAGGTEVMVYTPDRDDLFATLTRGFDAHGLSIMSARIHTTRSGFALDTFVVLDRDNQPVTATHELDALSRALRTGLSQAASHAAPVEARLPRVLKHFPIRTRTHFSRVPDGSATLMEITAQDRPGLLYQIALVLQARHLRVLKARVATYGERAEDIFTISSESGDPLDDATSAWLADEIARRLDGKTGEAA